MWRCSLPNAYGIVSNRLAIGIVFNRRGGASKFSPAKHTKLLIARANRSAFAKQCSEMNCFRDSKSLWDIHQIAYHHHRLQCVSSDAHTFFRPHNCVVLMCFALSIWCTVCFIRYWWTVIRWFHANSISAFVWHSLKPLIADWYGTEMTMKSVLNHISAKNLSQERFFRFCTTELFFVLFPSPSIAHSLAFIPKHELPGGHGETETKEKHCNELFVIIPGWTFFSIVQFGIVPVTLTDQIINFIELGPKEATALWTDQMWLLLLLHTKIWIQLTVEEKNRMRHKESLKYSN